MTEPIDMSTLVIKARRCPHYITIERAKTLASMCQRCETSGPPGVYGQAAKSGPTSRTRQPDLPETQWPTELEDAA